MIYTIYKGGVFYAKISLKKPNERTKDNDN